MDIFKFFCKLNNNIKDLPQDIANYKINCMEVVLFIGKQEGILIHYVRVRRNASIIFSIFFENVKRYLI